MAPAKRCIEWLVDYGSASGKVIICNSSVKTEVKDMFIREEVDYFI